jgi:shikimate dehydrogenase
MNPTAQRRRVLLGLIGHPIGHSAAPAMHEAAGDALGLRVLYQLLDIAAAGPDRLRQVLDGVRAFGFAGVNVTFPYKEAVLPLLDRLSAPARDVAAVNTVVVRNGQLIGHNTDTTGFGRALMQELHGEVPGPVALLGAGGMGRAAGFALRACRVAVRVFDTDPAKAARLAGDLGGEACASVAEAMADAAGVVNASPIGMLPNRDSPVPEALLHDGLWVADAVYHPLVTPLLAAARRVGARTLTGRSLSIHQALDAFALFSGEEAEEGVVAAAFDAVVGRA